MISRHFSIIFLVMACILHTTTPKLQVYDVSKDFGVKANLLYVERKKVPIYVFNIEAPSSDVLDRFSEKLTIVKREDAKCSFEDLDHYVIPNPKFNETDYKSHRSLDGAFLRN